MPTVGRRRLRGLAQLGAYVGIVAVAAVGFYYHQGEIRRAEQARVALCSLRVDLDKRIAGSKEFLADHPHGIPGIPASLIRQSLANSERTRRALEVLDCPAAGGKP